MSKVLIVEDEKIIQVIHKFQLEKLGCEVDIAHSGEEALSKMENDYDLILLDIGLPGIGGIEVIRAIRALQLNIRNVPIVVVTSFISDGVRATCLAAGANALYLKPLREEDFNQIAKLIR